MVNLFSPSLRRLWVLAAVATLLSQVVPLPPWGPVPLYSYVVAKGLLFLLTGVLTPLAFWRFNSLGFGASFAVLTTIVAEAVQFLIAGHRTRTWELLAKLLLLFIGFAVSLEVRHDRGIKLGPLHLNLTDPKHSA